MRKSFDEVLRGNGFQHSGSDRYGRIKYEGMGSILLWSLSTETVHGSWNIP